MNDLTDNQTTEDATPSPLQTAFSRRRLLIGGGVGALALVAAACGDDDEQPAASGGSDDSSDDSGAEGDLAVAAVASGLEQLAVNTYGAALDAAGKGALGEVPPAVAEFVTTARAHHQAHLDAWKGVLEGAGKEVGAVPADLEATVNEEFGKVTDVIGAAKLARTLETIAAHTYLAVIPTLKDKAAIELASTIQPIDMQHIAILNFVLGEYPVPDTFAKTDQAYSG